MLGGNAEQFVRVYPRTGGGTLITAPAEVITGGLSPHRRGNLSARCCASRICRSRAVYPRTGGGTGIGTPSPASTLGLSPHRRGNLRS